MKKQIWFVGLGLLLHVSVHAFFDFSSINQEFEHMHRAVKQFSAEMNTLFDADFSNREVVAVGELKKSAFQAGMSIKEDEKYLYLQLVFGELFAAEDVSAEIRSGRLIVLMQNKELTGRLEVDAQRAFFSMGEIRSKESKKEDSELYAAQEFRSSSMLSFPSRVNLSVDPEIQVENGVMTIQFSKYQRKNIKINKKPQGPPGQRGDMQVLEKVEGKIDTHHELENELK